MLTTESLSLSLMLANYSGIFEGVCLVALQSGEESGFWQVSKYKQN